MPRNSDESKSKGPAAKFEISKCFLNCVLNSDLSHIPQWNFDKSAKNGHIETTLEIHTALS